MALTLGGWADPITDAPKPLCSVRTAFCKRGGTQRRYRHGNGCGHTFLVK